MYRIFYREEYEGLGIGRVERDQDFTTSLGFYRNEFQIQYIFRGERLFFCEGECYRMTEGCLAFIDKKKIAKTCIIGGKYHDRLLIEMKESSFTYLGELLGIDLEAFFSTHHGVYNVGGNPVFREILERLEDIILHDDSEMKAARIKTEVLQIILRQKEWENLRCGRFSEQGLEPHVEKHKRVHQVADYIAENYKSIDSVDELASRFYMSDSYLCRIFKEVTNYTISEYINLYRIAAGRMMLQDEKYNMTEIANLLGYDSLTYFERVFKKQVGMTPLQYRKLKTGK